MTNVSTALESLNRELEQLEQRRAYLWGEIDKHAQAMRALDAESTEVEGKIARVTGAIESLTETAA